MAQLLSSGELAEHEFERPPFLVEPLIPYGGIFMIHGPGDVGKTQFTLGLAGHINRGTPLFGKWDTKSGPVVFIQADMTGMIQQLRVRAVINDMDIEDIYWAVGDEGGTMDVDVTRMLIRKKGLVEQIREIDPAMIVWDTLQKIHRLDENSNQTPRAVLGAIREMFPHTTHQLIHHNRGEAKKDDEARIEGEEFRGHTAWRDDLDAIFELRPRGSAPVRVSFHVHKARTAPEAQREDVLLEMDPVTGLFAPVEPSIEGRVTPVEQERIIYPGG